MRTTVLVGAAALGLAVGLPGAVRAATAPPQAVPAYRGAEGAKKIEGKASSADAPLVAAGAVYTDTVPQGERYYRLSLDDRSSVYFSVVALPVSGVKYDYGDGVEVEIMTSEGRRCPNQPSRAGFGPDSAPVTTVAVRRLEEDAECQAAGVYFAKVTRSVGKDSDLRALPVELRLQREPGLASGSAPTTAPSVWPSASPTLPGTEPVARTGGTGFNDARALDSGVWRDDLRPGQTRFYRVPLDWGRQLGLSAELANASMTKSSGFAAGGLTVSVYTPFRALMADKDISYDGKQAGVTLPKTAPVAYENRFADDAGARLARVAGWYYIAVTLAGKVGEFTEDAVPVPLTLRMDVTGKPAKAPVYKESLTAAGFGVGEEDRAAARQGLTAPEATEAAGTRSVMRVVAGAGFAAGTVLLLVLGGWILLARRGRSV
ncbi:hypothetical protein AB0I68_37485 [Streptomyces sp. NPDC050448]|uniref:hypothetical protein n=1 Tax=Streptomyces sp. NPDC050448 TaxID=3155404 RepID=UPI00342D108F